MDSMGFVRYILNEIANTSIEELKLNKIYYIIIGGNSGMMGGVNAYHFQDNKKLRHSLYM